MQMKTRSPKWAAALAAAVLTCSLPAFASENKVCPIMTDTEVDPEYVVQSAGTDVGLCCGACDKLWKKNEAYYTKAALELGLLPQLKGKEAELGLDKVQLLEQRFCPIKDKNIITPDSPSTEYKGVKIYFYKDAQLRKWNEDPEKYAKAAIEAGLLPQLAGK